MHQTQGTQECLWDECSTEGTTRPWGCADSCQLWGNSQRRSLPPEFSLQVVRVLRLTILGSKNKVQIANPRERERALEHPIEPEITVINRSSTTLTSSEQEVLSLGQNFALSLQDLPVKEVIVNTEDTARKLDAQTVQLLCERVNWSLEQYKPPTKSIIKNHTSNIII